MFQRYEGRIGARKGIFPATYVDVTVEPGETRSTGGNLLIIYQLSNNWFNIQLTMFIKSYVLTSFDLCT